MSYNVYEVHTWICSIPRCAKSITGAWKDHARNEGWESQMLFGEEFDLCPDHTQQIRKFLFRDENDPDPHS